MYMAKSCTGVFLACMFLFVPSDTFAVRSRLARKRTAKKRIEENAAITMNSVKIEITL